MSGCDAAIRFFSGLSLLCCATLRPAWADVVLFKSGLEASGEIVRDVPDEGVIWLRRKDARPNTPWTTDAIERSTILHVSREPGDQSDGRRDPPGHPAPAAGGSPRPPLLQATLVLTTGDTMHGAVIRLEPPQDLEFRLQPEGKGGTTRRVKLVEIRSLTISGAAASDDLEVKKYEDLVPLLLGGLPPKPAKDEVLVLALSGTFKEDSAFGIGRTITPETFDALVNAALARKPAAIVLDIDSGGGSIDVMNRIIERALDLQRNRNVRLVAWPSRAGSAAAILSLACREIIPPPTTRMGAAIAIFPNGEAVPAPKNAAEQKEKAWEDSIGTLVFELTGRSQMIQRAMENASLQVWFHPTKGFSEQRPFRKPDEASDWIALDDSPTLPLVLTGEQLRAIHFASEFVSTSDALPAALGLPADTAVRRLDLNDPAIQAPVERLQARILRAYQSAVEARQRVEGRLRAAIVKAKTAIEAFQQVPKDGWTEAIVSTIQRCTREAKLAIPSLRGADREQIERWKDEEGWISHFDFKTKGASDLYEVVLKSLADVKRNSGALSSSLLDRLRSAHNLLADALNGPGVTED